MVPVIASEYGWTSDGFYHDSETRQADYTIRAAALTFGKLDKLIWYVSQEKQDSSRFENHFGLIRTWSGVEYPYEAKPVFAALSNFNAMLGQAELLKESHIGDIYDYEFIRPDGSIVNMIWTEDKENVGYRKNADEAGSFRIYDIYGNCIKSGKTGKELLLTAGASPVYVEFYNDFMEFTNEDGHRVESLSEIDGGRLSVRVTEDIKGVIVAASYKDGRLLALEFKNINEAADNRILIETAGADLVKAFLWDGIDTMHPLAEAVEIK